LGKTAHFRKHGMAVPPQTANRNWKTLHQLFRLHQPQRVCFLGDLFHSAENREWKVFGELVQSYEDIKFELVMGNHDILEAEAYHKLGFEVYEENKVEGPFLLTHEPQENSGLYNLAGHIHPGVKLSGKGRQSHKTACFYFGETNAILPAFGSFTGLAKIPVKEKDQVFVVVEDRVIPM
jgi:DNA ligase-associated metallophosphoesterase